MQHGDGVKDITFEVDNVEWIVENARLKNAKIVRDVTVESDKHGSIKYASIQTV